MRACLLVIALAACSKSDSSSKQLDPTLIEVVDNARLRTDTVGDQQFASESTFVLVDAKNPTSDGAYVTLAGDLRDAGGGVVGHLKAQSLWIPASDTRTFALVDTERVPRPTTTSAKIIVTGALVTHDPPRMRITDLHTFVDRYTEKDKSDERRTRSSAEGDAEVNDTPVSRIVAQANVVNDAPRLGKAIVIASFHDADGRPLTRPFQIVEIDGNKTGPIQFVGPPGSVRGTIFVGDVIY